MAYFTHEQRQTEAREKETEEGQATEQVGGSGIRIRPSRLYLPKLESPPGTIFEHLLARFPRVDPRTWRRRVLSGLVTLSDGSALREDSPYRHGIFVFYRKEVPSEPPAMEEALVVYRDDEILVADKPHGMSVTPAGEHVERSLLVRLQNSSGLEDLAPMHRLDRDTAGLVLFGVKPASRGHYHRLFSEGAIEREYLAVAHVVDAPGRKRWRVENRMEPGDPWFCRRIVEGPANAITEIELLAVEGDLALFRLLPQTGKKHQLRLHMASIGFPVEGDILYPSIRDKNDGDPPLQLLAHRLAFIDPLSGAPRSFISTRKLHCFVSRKKGATDYTDYAD